MSHPQVRARRRRNAFLIAFNAAMLAWMLFVMMTYGPASGLGDLAIVLGAWTVGGIAAGLYAGYAPLPGDVPAAPRRTTPPPLT